jgi:hypothetical protein
VLAIVVVFTLLYIEKTQTCIREGDITRDSCRDPEAHFMCCPGCSPSRCVNCQQTFGIKGKLGMRTTSHFIDALENGVDQPRKTVTILCKK